MHKKCIFILFKLQKFRFNDVPDIKIFKKEDEPSSKGLSETEVEDYMKKLET